jgi:hypothetical protein
MSLCRNFIVVATSTLLLAACAGQSQTYTTNSGQSVTMPKGTVTGGVNAVQAIEQSTGGKVLDIRFSNAKGVPSYHAVILKTGQIHFFQLADLSKKVVELDATSTPVWMLNWRGKADVHYAKVATVSLSTAIRTAQQFRGAPAAAAGLARSVSNPDSDVQAYTVVLDDRGSVRSVSIDMSTGEVIADPSALSY